MPSPVSLATTNGSSASATESTSIESGGSSRPLHASFRLGGETAFILNDPYQMPVLDLSLEVGMSYRFTDRFTLRLTGGFGYQLGVGQHDYIAGEEPPPFEEWEYNQPYSYPSDVTATRSFRGSLFGMASPQAHLGAQIQFSEMNGVPVSYYPTIGFRLDSVVTTKTEQGAIMTKIPDSDVDMNTDPDRVVEFLDPVTTSTSAPAVLIDVMPASFKVGAFEFGMGASIIFSSGLEEPVTIAPTVGVNLVLDTGKK